MLCSSCSISFQLQSGGKSSRITGFNDPGISDGRVIIDLVDTCKPGCIKYDNVKTGTTDEASVPSLSVSVMWSSSCSQPVYTVLLQGLCVEMPWSVTGVSLFEGHCMQPVFLHGFLFHKAVQDLVLLWAGNKYTHCSYSSDDVSFLYRFWCLVKLGT